MQYFQTTGKSWIMYERLWFSSLSFVVLHLLHICLAYSVNTTTESKLYRHLQRFSTSLYWGFPSSQRHSNSSSLLKERSEVTARLWRLPLRISQATCTAAPVTLWERTTIIESLSAPVCCSTQHLQYGICCYLHNVKWYKHFRHVTFSSNLQAVVHQGFISEISISTSHYWVAALWRGLQVLYRQLNLLTFVWNFQPQMFYINNNKN